MYLGVCVDDGVYKTLELSYRLFVTPLTGDWEVPLDEVGRNLLRHGVSILIWSEAEMLSVNCASESETLLSKLERWPELSLPSSRVEVLTCMKRRRRFLPDSSRSCSSFKVLDVKDPAVSAVSKDALSQCSDLTPTEDSVLLVHGDLVLSVLTAVVGLNIRSFCRNEESLLGVSHQVSAAGRCISL